MHASIGDAMNACILRPIVTETGIMQMTMNLNPPANETSVAQPGMTESLDKGTISIRNLSKHHFAIKKFGIITSVINTRRCSAEVNSERKLIDRSHQLYGRVTDCGTTDYWTAAVAESKVSVVSDCSGCDISISALYKLCGSVDHLSSTEICPAARKSILANYEPKDIPHDITKRDNTKLTSAGLYIAGFPCQPFSRAGLKKGFEDNKNGHTFSHISDYINIVFPKAFMLENVEDVQTHDEGKTMICILKELHKSDRYNIHINTMNTEDHGIPQHRKRLYICGIFKTCDMGTFRWPDPIPSRWLLSRLRAAMNAEFVPPH